MGIQSLFFPFKRTCFTCCGMALRQSVFTFYRLSEAVCPSAESQFKNDWENLFLLLHDICKQTNECCFRSVVTSRRRPAKLEIPEIFSYEIGRSIPIGVRLVPLFLIAFMGIIDFFVSMIHLMFVCRHLSGDCSFKYWLKFIYVIIIFSCCFN